MVSEDGVELIAQLADEAVVDLHVGELALHTTARLVDHDAGVGQDGTLTLLACGEQNGTHRGGQSGTNGSNIWGNVLHGVVHAHTSDHTAAGAVDEHLDIALGINGFQKEKLGLHYVCDVVRYRNAHEDDAVHHQAAKDV